MLPFSVVVILQLLPLEVSNMTTHTEKLERLSGMRHVRSVYGSQVDHDTHQTIGITDSEATAIKKKMTSVAGSAHQQKPT